MSAKCSLNCHKNTINNSVTLQGLFHLKSAQELRIFLLGYIWFERENV